jgi:hypothetical protein
MGRTPKKFVGRFGPSSIHAAITAVSGPATPNPAPKGLARRSDTATPRRLPEIVARARKTE